MPACSCRRKLIFRCFRQVFHLKKCMIWGQLHGMSEEKIKVDFFSCWTYLQLVGGIVNCRIEWECPKCLNRCHTKINGRSTELYSLKVSVIPKQDGLLGTLSMTQLICCFSGHGIHIILYICGFCSSCYRRNCVYLYKHFVISAGVYAHSKAWQPLESGIITLSFNVDIWCVKDNLNQAKRVRGSDFTSFLWGNLKVIIIGLHAQSKSVEMSHLNINFLLKSFSMCICMYYPFLPRFVLISKGSKIRGKSAEIWL